jgi:hypothetical protein
MIEVTISMQQRMALQETKRRYQTVDRFADRVPMLAKAAEIPCGLDRQSSATRFKQFKVAKFLQDSHKCLLAADSLEGLTKNQVREAETLATDLTIEVVGSVLIWTLIIPRAQIAPNLVLQKYLDAVPIPNVLCETERCIQCPKCLMRGW